MLELYLRDETGFKKLITKCNSSYDIINCNIIMTLIIPKIPSIILFTQWITSSTEPWFFLTFD